MESLEIKLSDDTLQSLARLISGVVAQLQDSPRPMTPSERAVHANYAGQKPPTEFGLLVGTREAAKTAERLGANVVENVQQRGNAQADSHRASNPMGLCRTPGMG